MTLRRSAIPICSKCSGHISIRRTKAASLLTGGDSIGVRSFTEMSQSAGLPRLQRSSLEQSGVFRKPIVTEIVPFTKFYEAEKYHQDFFKNHVRPIPGISVWLGAGSVPEEDLGRPHFGFVPEIEKGEPDGSDEQERHPAEHTASLTIKSCAKG